MSSHASEFQQQCIRVCEDLLRSVTGIRYSNFVRVAGFDDIYYKVSVSAGQHYLQVFIYQEEAGYQLDGAHWMAFDRPAYGSEETLIHSLRESLRGTLFTLCSL